MEAPFDGLLKEPIISDYLIKQTVKIAFPGIREWTGYIFIISMITKGKVIEKQVENKLTVFKSAQYTVG